jgi:diguanylate cyclase (GGDEF)-like protein
MMCVLKEGISAMKTLLFSDGYEGPGYSPANALRVLARYLMPDSLPKWGGVTLLSFAAAWSGVALGQVVFAGADIVWPANGLLLGFLLRMPRRYWFSYLAGSVLASLAVHEIYPFPVTQTLLFSLGNIVEIMLAAILLTNPDRKPLDLTDPSSLAGFGFFGVLVPALAATVFVQLIQAGSSGVSSLVALLNFFAGDAIGLAVMTPLVLSVDPQKLAALFRPARRFEALAILTGVAVISVAVFAQKGLPIVFVLFPALLLAAFRLGTSGAALGLFLMVVPAACFTAFRRGPFSPASAGSFSDGIFLLQGFFLVTLITVLGAAAALTHRERMTLELSEAFREAHAHAALDHTTGLANRRTFDKELAREWRRALREQVQISLLMIDVDFFKLYNDHYGHVAGDACLRAVADILAKGPLRASDLVARYGGEEFALLLPRAGLQGATIMAELIRHSIVDAAIPHIGNLSGVVTISVGVATIRPTEATPETALVEKADAALYCAKREGRNQVWSQEIDSVSKPDSTLIDRS